MGGCLSKEEEAQPKRDEKSPLLKSEEQKSVKNVPSSTTPSSDKVPQKQKEENTTNKPETQNVRKTVKMWEAAPDAKEKDAPHVRNAATNSDRSKVQNELDKVNNLKKSSQSPLLEKKKDKTDDHSSLQPNVVPRSTSDPDLHIEDHHRGVQQTSYEGLCTALVQVIDLCTNTYEAFLKEDKSVSVEALRAEAIKSLDSAISITMHTHSLQSSRSGATSLQKSVKKIESTLVEFFSAVAAHDQNKARAQFTEVNKFLAVSMRASTVLVHQSGVSKQLKSAAEIIDSSIENDKLQQLLAKASDWHEKLIKTVKVASSVLQRLADAVSKGSDIELDIFVKSISVCSVDFERSVGLLLDQLDSEAPLQQELLNAVREINGACVLLQVAITEVTGMSKKEVGSEAPTSFLLLSAAVSGFSNAVVSIVDAAVEVQAHVQQRLKGHFVSKHELPTPEMGDSGPLWADNTEVVYVEEEASTPTPVQPTEVRNSNSIRASLVEHKKVKAASFNKLIILLTSENSIDIHLTKTFLTTYLSFCTPAFVFKKLLERYNVPKLGTKATEELKQNTFIIQARVGSFLKEWIDRCSEDIDSSLLKRIQQFCDAQLIRDGHDGIAKQIKATIEKKLDKRKTALVSQPKGISDLSPVAFLLNEDLELIAKQLTWIEFNLYSSIRSSEFLFQSWNKPKLKYRAPNILRMISRFNNVSLWIGSCILWQANPDDRLLALANCITLAQHLRRLNNFNTTFAILAGLELSAIHRLKLMEKLPKAKQKAYTDLLELMNSKSSFKNYRTAVLESSPPLIPYLGLYLTDITFADDGNPNLVNNLINFRKYDQICHTIQEIEKYQQWKYEESFNSPRLSLFLEEIPHHNNDMLYDLSLLIVPREKKV